MHKSPERSRILVCGTARNVEKKFYDTHRRIKTSFSDFQEVKIIVCESFSTDKTLEVLAMTQVEDSDFVFIVDSDIASNEERRTVRIASARNAIQSYVMNHYSDFDYVVMLDLDGVNRDLTSHAIRSAWDFSDWDAVFANQSLIYYDIWALRAADWCEEDCWRDYNKLQNFMSVKQAKRIAVTSKMKKISKKSQPILVRSAFGGLGIYTMKSFLDSRYLGSNSEEDETCEHVFFNETLTDQGYKLYIMPSLINLNMRSQYLNILKEHILRTLAGLKIHF